MHKIDQFRESFLESAKDIRLNLPQVLTPEGAPGLQPKQIATIALACAYATRSSPLIAALLQDFKNEIGPVEIEGAQAAATIMAMNNVYYRTQYQIEETEIKKLPARLRMNVIGKPPIPKLDFELACLAASSISGCSACINAHIAEAKKSGVSLEGIHSSIRIAATIQATSLAEWISATSRELT